MPSPALRKPSTTRASPMRPTPATGRRAVHIERRTATVRVPDQGDAIVTSGSGCGDHLGMATRGWQLVVSRSRRRCSRHGRREGTVTRRRAQVGTGKRKSGGSAYARKTSRRRRQGRWTGSIARLRAPAPAGARRRCRWRRSHRAPAEERVLGQVGGTCSGASWKLVCGPGPLIVAQSSLSAETA